MSYYAVLDNADQTGGDVATISGWGDFGRWVDSLRIDVSALVALREHGLSDNLIQLEADLKMAIKQGGHADVLDIANGLLVLLANKADAEVIVITDGAGT